MSAGYGRMTDHHLIDARDKRLGELPAKPADFTAQVAGAVAWFDYHVEEKNAPYLECKNARLLAANLELDYAIIEQVPQEVIEGKPQAEKVLNEAIKIREILNSLSAALKARIDAAQAAASA